jgi:hypothetical protein
MPFFLASTRMFVSAYCRARDSSPGSARRRSPVVRVMTRVLLLSTRLMRICASGRRMASVPSGSRQTSFSFKRDRSMPAITSPSAKSVSSSLASDFGTTPYDCVIVETLTTCIAAVSRRLISRTCVTTDAMSTVVSLGASNARFARRTLQHVPTAANTSSRIASAMTSAMTARRFTRSLLSQRR